VICHHADGLAAFREPEHQLDEIAARGGQPARAKDPGGAHDQRFVQVCLSVQLAGQLGYGIRAQRVGGIVFGVGMAGSAIEDVVGGEVNQPRVDLAAGQREVAHGQRVDQERRLRLLFGNIHLIVGRRIENDLRVRLRQRVFDRCAVRDIDLPPLPAHDGVSTRLEAANQLDAELAGGSENHCGAGHGIFMMPEGHMSRQSGTVMATKRCAQTNPFRKLAT
jgi:hypothetical protein